MNLAEVPGIQIIEATLKRIGGVALSSAEYLFSRTVYRLVLSGQEREGIVELSSEFLSDLRDNKAQTGIAYANELNNRLEHSLWKVIEHSGLIGYNESSLSYLLLKFISEATKSAASVHKYNTIGRGTIGDFERWTKATLSPDEKETLIWVWNELSRHRFISPTGTDLVEPDNWVKLTAKGVAAIAPKEFEQWPRPSLLEPHPPNSSTATERKQSRGPFEYDVAISFAGEQRPEADGIARCLDRANVRVFYDAYEQSSLWGKNLYDHLADVYQKKARYCLMLVSAAYAAKVWPNHERQNAQARALSEKEEYILPVRFDETEIPGLTGTVAYLRFQDHGVEGICKLLLEKVNRTVPNSPQTPAVTPPVKPTDPPEYQAQRNQLPSTPIFQKIISKPHWRIWIRPTEFKSARFRNLEQCRYFMKSQSVRSTSRIPYPFVPYGDISEKGNDWIAEETDGPNELERWNLFRSCQFVHYRAIDDRHFSEHIHVLEILDTVSQAFELAARLASHVALQGAMAITIDLLAVDGLALMWPADNFGLQNLAPANCWSQDQHVNAMRTIAAGELTAGNRGLALDVVMEIFSKFSWPEPPREKFHALQSQRFASID